MRIGFIGLGNMGGPMALNLIKAGHALVVHDVRSELAKAYLERGAKAADNPRGAAQGAELILTSLPGPAEVESVALGERGVIHGAAKNAVYADLSTGSPRVMRTIHAAFKEKGIHVLGAPVRGGGGGAQRGTVQMVVGGGGAVFQHLKTVVGALGGKEAFMGEMGCGTIAKLVHNMIRICTRQVVAEAFTLGGQAGGRPEAPLPP